MTATIASAPIDRIDIALIICFLFIKEAGTSSRLFVDPSRQSVEQFREGSRLVSIC
jgi:hypothetical protein